eukprot:Awhi_evm2s15566
MWKVKRNVNFKTKRLSKVLCQEDACLFDKAEKEILKLVEDDLFQSFIQETLAKEELILAKRTALWFIETEGPRVFYDGHIEEKEKNQTQAVKPKLVNFFSFPNPIVTIDSQAQSLVSMFLILLVMTFDLVCFFILSSNSSCSRVFRYLPLVYDPFVYGFLARFACGPRLSPQSFFVLLFLTPLLAKYFPQIFTYDLVPGPPKRFAQLCGFSITLLALVLRISDCYFMSDSFTTDSDFFPHHIIDHPLFLASIGVWFFAACIMSLNAFLNFCVGCWIYNRVFVKLGLAKPVCQPKINIPKYVQESQNTVTSSSIIFADMA